MAKKDFKGIPNSAFQNLSPVALDSVSYKGYATGLRFPDGSLMAFPQPNRSYAATRQLAKALNAEVVTIKGTWSFTVDLVSDKMDENNDD